MNISCGIFKLITMISGALLMYFILMDMIFSESIYHVNILNYPWLKPQDSETPHGGLIFSCFTGYSETTSFVLHNLLQNITSNTLLPNIQFKTGKPRCSNGYGYILFKLTYLEVLNLRL